MERVSRLIDRRTRILGRDAVIALGWLLCPILALGPGMGYLLCGGEPAIALTLGLLLLGTAVKVLSLLPKSTAQIEGWLLGRSLQCRVTSNRSIKDILQNVRTGK